MGICLVVHILRHFGHCIVSIKSLPEQQCCRAAQSDCFMHVKIRRPGAYQPPHCILSTMQQHSMTLYDRNTMPLVPRTPFFCWAGSRTLLHGNMLLDWEGWIRGGQIYVSVASKPFISFESEPHQLRLARSSFPDKCHITFPILLDLHFPIPILMAASLDDDLLVPIAILLLDLPVFPLRLPLELQSLLLCL